jgi:hypothetical protein
LAQARPRVLAPALVLLLALLLALLVLLVLALALALERSAPWPLALPQGAALLRALALALARRLPGQGRARREPLCRGVPGLVPPHVSSQPRPVRSWIGHG